MPYVLWFSVLSVKNLSSFQRKRAMRTTVEKRWKIDSRLEECSREYGTEGVCIEERSGYLKYFLATSITWKLRYVRKTYFYRFSCVDFKFGRKQR